MYERTYPFNFPFTFGSRSVDRSFEYIKLA